jgi:hypothetical protein
MEGVRVDWWHSFMMVDNAGGSIGDVIPRLAM